MIVLILTCSLLLIFLIIAAYNFFTAPLFRKKNNFLSYKPSVSVLIPARDEEENIGKILSDLAGQDYNNLEVIVGNDNSSDNTEKIIDEYSDKYQFIKKLNVPPLPGGWKGKSNALNELYKCAKGDLILFIDADIKMESESISSAVYYLRYYEADALTVFPRQIMKSFGEGVVIPLLNFFLLSILPLKQVYTSKRESLSAGIGQFMLFRKQAYERAGKHEAVKDKIAEDLELVRITKGKGLKVLTLLDNGLISCRMYMNFNSALDGFTKNFFNGSSLSVPLFLLMLFIYSSAFLLPFFMVFFNIYFIVPLLLVILIRVLISLRSGQSLIYIILHPFQIFTLFVIGLRSVFMQNRIMWKGRTL